MIIIYDAQCRLCTFSVDWLKQRNAPENIRAVPCGSDAQRTLAPAMTTASCMEEIRLITEAGRELGGFPAVAFALSQTPGYRFLGRLLSMRPIVPIGRRLYRWVAKNRYNIVCDEHCKSRHAS